MKDAQDKPARAVSERKLKANQENAKKSTGPKTACGKRNSSFNAMKHGLLAKRIKIEDKSDADGLRPLEAKLHARYGGDSDQDVRNELLLELALVDCWRYARGLDAENRTRFESEEISWFEPTPYLGTALMRYITSNRHALIKTLNLLEQGRIERLKQESRFLNSSTKDSAALKRASPGSSRSQQGPSPTFRSKRGK